MSDPRCPGPLTLWNEINRCLMNPADAPNPQDDLLLDADVATQVFAVLLTGDCVAVGQLYERVLRAISGKTEWLIPPRHEEKIAIVSENMSQPQSYRAVAGNKRSVGKTAGEALDALAAQLDDEERGALVLVRLDLSDRFLTEQQQHRLQQLWANWRETRIAGKTMPAEDQAELDALVQVEARASSERARVLLEASQQKPTPISQPSSQPQEPPTATFYRPIELAWSEAEYEVEQAIKELTEQ